MRWKGIDALGLDPGADGQPAADLKSVLFKRIGVWRAAATSDEQERIDRLVAALEVRWLFRQWQSTLDSPPSPNKL